MEEYLDLDDQTVQEEAGVDPKDMSVDERKRIVRQRFSLKRQQLTREISENAQQLASIRNIKDVQTKVLSLRQRLLEENHSLLNNKVTLGKRLRQARATEMERLTQNVQHRYQQNEKAVVIEGRVSDLIEFMEILDNQIGFYKDSIKTVDSIIFGIRDRLTIEKDFGL